MSMYNNLENASINDHKTMSGINPVYDILQSYYNDVSNGFRRITEYDDIDVEYMTYETLERRLKLYESSNNIDLNINIADNRKVEKYGDEFMSTEYLIGKSESNTNEITDCDFSLVIDYMMKNNLTHINTIKKSKYRTDIRQTDSLKEMIENKTYNISYDEYNQYGLDSSIKRKEYSNKNSNTSMGMVIPPYKDDYNYMGCPNKITELIKNDPDLNKYPYITSYISNYYIIRIEATRTYDKEIMEEFNKFKDIDYFLANRNK